VRAKRYDLVFMDHMMPEMDGAEAVKRIRALDASEAFDPAWFREMPIIALSANAVSGARKTFLEAGMNDFLPKPIEAEEFNAMLLKWLPPDKITMIKQAKPGEGGTKYDALLKELKKLDIMDLSAGLSHVGNNEAAYVQILRQFCAEFDGYVKEIERFLGAENWREYSIRLHAMKGVFANIGIDEISKWAYQLEFASKNANYAKCKEETEIFLETMFGFKAKLLTTSLMKREEVTEKLPTTPAGLIKTLEALREACGQGMSDEADALADELTRVTLNETADPVIAELCELIASLDYDKAIEKTEELLKSLQQE
jgi:CheY-like chemotaxis protein